MQDEHPKARVSPLLPRGGESESETENVSSAEIEYFKSQVSIITAQILDTEQQISNFSADQRRSKQLSEQMLANPPGPPTTRRTPCTGVQCPCTGAKCPSGHDLLICQSEPLNRLQMCSHPGHSGARIQYDRTGTWACKGCNYYRCNECVGQHSREWCARTQEWILASTRKDADNEYDARLKACRLRENRIDSQMKRRETELLKQKETQRVMQLKLKEAQKQAQKQAQKEKEAQREAQKAQREAQEKAQKEAHT